MSTVFSQRGFSLVELMVVVAIIGLLSVFAFTSYREYQVKSRINGELVPAMTQILDRAKSFAEINGRFPTGEELGLVSSSCDTVSMPKYGAGWGGGANPNSNDACGMGDACGRTFGMALYLNGTELGIPADLAGVTVISFYLLKINNMYQTFCFFQTGGSWDGPWAQERYISGCYNGNSSGISADGGDWVTTTTPLFAAAACP